MPVLRNLSSQACHKPNSGGVPSSPSPAFYSIAPASPLQQAEAGAGVLHSPPAPAHLWTYWGKQPMRARP